MFPVCFRKILIFFLYVLNGLTIRQTSYTLKVTVSWQYHCVAKECKMPKMQRMCSQTCFKVYQFHNYWVSFTCSLLYIYILQIAKDAKECVQECVSEFISFITSEYPFTLSSYWVSSLIPGIWPNACSSYLIYNQTKEVFDILKLF